MRLPVMTSALRLPALLLPLALLFVAQKVEASPDFPAEVRRLVALDCTPQCTLCHRTNAGGWTTLVSGGFAEALRDVPPIDEALMGQQPSSIARAFDYARESGLDVNGNGVPDIEELEAGIYPDSGEPICGAGAASGPTYGCGARIEPRGRLDAGPLALLGLALAGLRRLRRADSERRP
jgi:hypothetical protein